MTVERTEPVGDTMAHSDTSVRRSTRDASVQHYLKELRKYPPMSREEEELTLKLARKGDQRAIDRVITSNLRFVVSVALEYQGRGVPLADLIAEAT